VAAAARHQVNEAERSVGPAAQTRKVWPRRNVSMTMKRLTIILTMAAASLPMAAARASTPARAASGAKLQIRHTTLGNILVNGRGFTVYAFTRDSRNHDSCVNIGGCTGIWPLVRTDGAPGLGPGVRRALVGTIKLPDGTRQVTYAGHPLYTYIGDSGPGDTSYVGLSQFGGRWPALNPAGHLVK